MKIRSSNGYNLPDAGEYTATLVEIKSEGKKLSKFGKEQEVLRFNFKLPNGMIQPAWLNAVNSPMSKLYEVASALLKKNPPQEIDTDALLDKRCKVFIKHYKGEDGRERARITDYFVAHDAPVQQEVPF